MNKRLTALFLAVSASSGFAHAQENLQNDGFYSGASISRWQYRDTSGDLDARLHTLELNSGFWFHPLLSAEVRVGTGLGDETLELGSEQYELAVKTTASAYWRPELANDSAKLYALLGYSHVELEVSNPSEPSFDMSDSGPSFGVGLGFYFEEQVTLNIEWRQLIDADGAELTGLSAGFDYRF